MWVSSYYLRQTTNYLNTLGNGTQELTIITDYLVTEAEFKSIVRAVQYQAPDWPTMDGEHAVHVSYEWACGELNDFDQIFLVTSPSIFPGVNAGADTIVCFPDTLSLNVASPLGTNFAWNNGDTSRIITVTEPGDYAVTVSNFCGADSAFFMVVANQDPPLTNESYLFELCPGDSVRFRPESDGARTHCWEDGSINPWRTFARREITGSYAE